MLENDQIGSKFFLVSVKLIPSLKSVSSSRCGLAFFVCVLPTFLALMELDRGDGLGDCVFVRMSALCSEFWYVTCSSVADTGFRSSPSLIFVLLPAIPCIPWDFTAEEESHRVGMSGC